MTQALRSVVVASSAWVSHAASVRATLSELANMNPPPESVPINHLVKVAGTPLEHEDDLDLFEFIRTIAIARILMPESNVRPSAGREQMDDGIQALCFMAGANSISTATAYLPITLRIHSATKTRPSLPALISTPPRQTKTKILNSQQ